MEHEATADAPKSPIESKADEVMSIQCLEHVVSCGSSDESVCAEPSPAMTHAQGTAGAAKEPTGDANTDKPQPRKDSSNVAGEVPATNEAPEDMHIARRPTVLPAVNEAPDDMSIVRRPTFAPVRAQSKS